MTAPSTKSRRDSRLRRRPLCEDRSRSLPRQIRPIREREVGGVVIREVMRLCKDGRLEDIDGSLVRGLNRKGLQTRKETSNLIKCDPLATVGHQKAVADFIESQEGN